MRRHRQRLSEGERDRRRAEDRERLRRAAEQLLSSEGWRRWVRARASNGLARYSLSNQLLVALQSEGRATFVAGFKRWLRLGYCVKKGERALRILAPMTVQERDRETGEETGETTTFFRTVFVFFQDQVVPLPERDPVPLAPPREPVTGDSHVRLIEPMRAFAESLGFSVSFEPIAGPEGGWCDTKGKRIVVDIDAPANARLRTLIHECAHALGIDYRSYSRAQAEVMVETVTLVAASTVGLAIDGEAIPYVSGWGEDGALEAVTEFAETIDQTARRIEDVLLAAMESGSAEPTQHARSPQPEQAAELIARRASRIEDATAPPGESRDSRAPEEPAQENKPTVRQLRYLRQLTDRTGTTFSPPATRREASEQIERLQRRSRSPRYERRADREEVSLALAEQQPASGVRPEEISGHGGECRWR